MSVETSSKKLRHNLNEQIKSFNEKRTKNRRRAFWLKILATTFSAITTILLGLKGFEFLAESSLLFRNLPLVLSALVTLVGTWDGFFNHRALWVKYTLTVSNLRGILAELDYISSDSDSPPSQKAVDRLFDQCQNVLSETNTSWQSMRDEK